MAKRKYKRRNSILPLDKRKEVAEKLFNGLMIKQVSAEYGISQSYTYQIFYEFLEWKVEWKHKEMKNATS